MTKKSKKKGEYTADSVRVLDIVDHIRLRPH